jgi:hypothetical protein
MRSTKAESREVNSPCVETIDRQIVRDLGLPRIAGARGLFNDDPLGTRNQSSHGGPERLSGALAVDSRGAAGLLAGRSSDEQVSVAVRLEGVDVIMRRHVRKVMREYATAPGVELTEVRRRDAGAVQSEGMATNAREDVPARHAFLPPLRRHFDRKFIR